MRHWCNERYDFHHLSISRWSSQHGDPASASHYNQCDHVTDCLLRYLSLAASSLVISFYTCPIPSSSSSARQYNKSRWSTELYFTADHCLQLVIASERVVSSLACRSLTSVPRSSSTWRGATLRHIGPHLSVTSATDASRDWRYVLVLHWNDSIQPCTQRSSLVRMSSWSPDFCARSAGPVISSSDDAVTLTYTSELQLPTVNIWEPCRTIPIRRLCLLTVVTVSAFRIWCLYVVTLFKRASQMLSSWIHVVRYLPADWQDNVRHRYGRQWQNFFGEVTLASLNAWHGTLCARWFITTLVTHAVCDYMTLLITLV